MNDLPLNGVRLLLLGLLFVSLLHADTGPKPYIDFPITYQIQPAPTLINGTLFYCNNADCSDARPMMLAGPQRLYCSQDKCSVTSYGFAPYLRLELQFSDKLRTSNVFPSPGFAGTDDLTVQNDNLSVEPGSFYTPPPYPSPYAPNAPTPGPALSDILVALLATLLIELPISAVAFWIWKKPMKMLWLVAAVNCVTVPALWISFAPVGQALSSAFNENIAVGAILGFLLLELLVVIIEAIVLWKFSPRFVPSAQTKSQKKKSGKTGQKSSPAGLSPLQAFILSFVMNLASMIGGFILLSIVGAIVGGL